jgi:hypothetical protein
VADDGDRTPMTDPIPSDETPQPDEPAKVRGCFVGGLATVGALIGGSIVAGALAFAIPLDSGVGAAIVGFVLVLLPVGLVVAAGVFWRKMPGFLLGIGLTIGISLVLITGCVAIISANA